MPVEEGKKWLALLELPEAFAADADFGPFHPALLDVAIGYALKFEPHSLYLPVSYSDLTIANRTWPRSIVSKIRRLDRAPGDGSFVSFEVTITDTEGEPLLVIGEYLLSRIASPAESLSSPDPRSIVRQSGIRQRPSREGLDPHLAAQVLGQVLKPGLPNRLIVSRSHAVEADARADPLAPETTLGSDPEGWIAAQWGRLLGVEAVGREDDFFALGGDSVLALESTAELNQQGWQLSPVDLYDYPTPASLGEFLVREQERQSPGPRGDRDSENSGSRNRLSDFPYAGIDQVELDEILEEFNDR